MPIGLLNDISLHTDNLRDTYVTIVRPIAMSVINTATVQPKLRQGWLLLIMHIDHARSV